MNPQVFTGGSVRVVADASEVVELGLGQVDLDGTSDLLDSHAFTCSDDQPSKAAAEASARRAVDDLMARVLRLMASEHALLVREVTCRPFK